MKKGESTRQRIIELAAPLFNRKGYAACSVQDVMDETGLQKGGIYRYFASKEELAAEVFQYSSALMEEQIFSIPAEITGELAKLRYAVERFCQQSPSIQGGCPLMNTAVEADDGNPLLRQLVKKSFQKIRKRVQTIVLNGIEAGEIRADADPAVIADVIISGLEGALMLSRLDRDRKPLQHIGHTLTQFLETQKAL